jgi:hypothetical protein
MYNLEDAITATFKEHLKVSSIESDWVPSKRK